jgi:predicted RNA-binding Zn ribbon-like protein
MSTRPALDFLNTRVGGRELLSRPSDLAAWFRDAGLARRPPRVASADLAAAVHLRGMLREALLDRDAVAVAHLADAWLSGERLGVCIDPATLQPRLLPAEPTSGCLLVPVVLDAVELARERIDRVRECAAEDCALVYLDESKNRSRRWCSMEVCGARAKAVAYYRRRRGGP